MKTLHLHRDRTTPARVSARPSTFRLGVIVSLVAAATAAVLRLLADVPTAVILVPVVVVGFTLSWRLAGHPDRTPPR
jgi:hypothetical protein